MAVPRIRSRTAQMDCSICKTNWSSTGSENGSHHSELAATERGVLPAKGAVWNFHVRTIYRWTGPASESLSSASFIIDSQLPPCFLIERSNFVSTQRDQLCAKLSQNKKIRMDSLPSTANQVEPSTMPSRIKKSEIQLGWSPYRDRNSQISFMEPNASVDVFLLS